MIVTSLDSFKCKKTLTAAGKTYTYFSLPDAEKSGLKGVSQLPFSMRVLLENLLRHEDGRTVKKADIEAMVAWLGTKGKSQAEIGFRPHPGSIPADDGDEGTAACPVIPGCRSGSPARRRRAIWRRRGRPRSS